MNLAENLVRSAAEHGDRVAIKLDDAELTYEQLDARRERGREPAAREGRRGRRPGRDHAPQRPLLPGRLLRRAASSARVVVPMNVLLKKREVGFYLSDPEAKVLFAWHDFAEAAEAGAEEAGAELILVKPGEFEELVGEHERHLRDRRPRRRRHRGDPLHVGDDRDARRAPSSPTRTWPATSRRSPASPTSTRPGSCSGRCRCSTPSARPAGSTPRSAPGACLTLIPRFDPGKALEIIQRDKVNVFEGVPTMYAAMLNHPERDQFDISCLELCASGGSAMPVEVMRAFEEAFGCKVLEGYGLSETSPVASFNHPDRERKPGSIGTPIEGVEMKVVDDDGNEVAQGEPGEIVIRGHNVMKGYWNRPEATEESINDDGWFKTGDMATVDEDGYFFIVDRKKDLIIRGGYNVYPREIEEVIYEHPAVREAAVVGVPHDELGEEVGAAVALKEGEDGDRGRDPRARQGAGRRLQVPARGLVRRRAAQGPDREDPQARDRGPAEVASSEG